MKTNVRSIRKRRKYSKEFKLRLVRDFETGKYSVLQLEKLHGVSNNSIYRWIYKLSTFNEKRFRIVEMKDSSNKKMKDLETRVKELEGALGRKQIKIDYLEKMMEIAKEELDIDIKKTSTPHSQLVQEKQTKSKFFYE